MKPKIIAHALTHKYIAIGSDVNILLTLGGKIGGGSHKEGKVSDTDVL